MLTLNPTKTLIIGFSFIVCLMVVVAGIGFQLSRSSHQQIDRLSNGQMVKLELLRKMKIASLNRSSQLQVMFLSDDPFAVDEAWLLFNSQAGLYIGYRDELKNLLSPHEMALLQSLDIAGGRLAQVHRKTGELFFNGELALARELLMDKAIPKRSEFMTQLSRFNDYEEKETAMIVESIRMDFKQALFNMLCIVAGVIGVTVAIGYYMFRHISVMTLVLAETNNTLENKVEERTQELNLAQESLIKFNNDLKHIASTDSLTGLSNRLMLDKRLRNALDRYQEKRTVFGVVIIDIDFFKKINDKFGHDIGDVVLKQFAKILKMAIKGKDSVGRWGGEEFLLVCVNRSEVELYGMCENIRKAIASYPFVESIEVTASFGMAMVDLEDDVHVVVKRADQALYLAKASGRNKVIVG